MRLRCRRQSFQPDGAAYADVVSEYAAPGRDEPGMAVELLNGTTSGRC